MPRPPSPQSTFLSLMTSTASEAASYEFTTLTCIPGVIEVSRGLPAPGRPGERVCECVCPGDHGDLGGRWRLSAGLLCPQH